MKIQWIIVIALAIGALTIDACTQIDAQTAGDIVTWTNPTTHVDGSPLNDLTSVIVSYGSKGGPYSGGSVTVAAPVTSATISRASGPGTICYVAVAVDSNGLQSSPSSESCKTVRSPPAPPSGLSVR